ncbi:MAG TPA: tetratricopeptide repeat protein [Burkholderiales bacterium]|nr:tetratricopeptide repeat protein [Burkholderiales bacterium]
MTSAEAVTLGLQHHGAGRLNEAEALYRQALAQDPDYIDALHFLGVVALQRGAHSQAVELISRALSRNAANAPAHNNLGLALAAQDRKTEAVAAYLAALALQPDYADALANVRAAVEQFHHRDALWVLGETHSRRNELDEAAACMERILASDPADADAHNLLGNIRRNQARHPEAIEHYELAIRHDPNPVVAWQNLLFCMMCSGAFSAADIHARHREFARRFEQPVLAAQPAFGNSRDPERRLKVGYVSPDFRANVVGHYMQPILENHDRAKFETHCYFLGSARDEVSARIASLVDGWHDAQALTEDALAALVRGHGIDVLVDLCGHGPGNRILAFARKPAPVQASYLDYSATTGLASIGYRLTTEYCDPSGTAEKYYSEKLHRLPGAYWTYNPAASLPVSALPARETGCVTFGSFNLYYRITSEVLDLWSRVLLAVPGSRLVIVSVAAGSTRAAVLDRLKLAGISSDRVSLHGVVPYAGYHALIGSVDIALAPWPYNGATTAMDCLWNGLPVISMAGRETFSTRLGCSVLAAAGLPELIATDAQDYVRIATELASDVPRLAALRRTLRQKLERSPLRDFRGFTKGLESAYRKMWSDWCNSGSGS